MNETDFIRQQLAVERAHLREILVAVHRRTATSPLARAISSYLDWSSRRLLEQLGAHRQALLAAPASGAATRARLLQLATAAQACQPAAARPTDVPSGPLLELLDAWSDSLDAEAGATLRISHWRAAAHLTADTILEERQLYAAARTAMGLA